MIGMSGDHQVFVCVHETNYNWPSIAGDDRRVRLVTLPVQRDAQEVQALADALANGGGMLTNPPGEDEGIQAAQRDDQGAQELPGLVAEQRDSFGGARVF